MHITRRKAPYVFPRTFKAELPLRRMQIVIVFAAVISLAVLSGVVHIPSEDEMRYGSDASSAAKRVIARRQLQISELSGADDGEDGAVLRAGPDIVGTEDNDDPAFEGSLSVPVNRGFDNSSYDLDSSGVKGQRVLKRRRLHAHQAAASTMDKELEKTIASVIHSTGAHSILDCPCSGDQPWIRSLIKRVERDVPGFKYYCVHNDATVLSRAQKSLQGLVHPSAFTKSEYWRDDALPAADLVVSWTGLEQLRSTDALSFLDRVRSGGAKHMLVGSFRRVSPQHARYGEWKAMVAAEKLNPKRLHDLSHPPFMFSDPSRRFSSLDPRLPTKELDLYRTEHLVNRFA